MSKYDNLDPRMELEQAIATDLKDALGKRGVTVLHNGTKDSHAPGGRPDIEASTKTHIIIFEVTKSKSSAQDREFQSIRDHLNNAKLQHPNKKVFCVFASPVTSARTLDSIHDHNQQRIDEDKTDTLIMPLAFETLELWVTRLKENVHDLYPLGDFLRLFGHYSEFIDDLRVRKLLAQMVFPTDDKLSEAVKRQEVELDEKTLEMLIKDLDTIENYMRQNGIATSQNAIDNLIYLVFMKLHDEKRSREKGQTNRLRSVDNFEHWRQDGVDDTIRQDNRAIHKLFTDIQREGEFLESQMFTPNDRLVDSIDDNFIMKKFIPVFGKYTFIGTKVDALGAVYEVLAQRAGKDVKVGQFFTPENVVRFMVRLAELDSKDKVLDPACGTGRFLIHAMQDMVEKIQKSNVRDKEKDKEQVRKHQCFGTDIDLRIAKIAKMNMWIHGDGKSNIKDFNGLILHKHVFNGNETYDTAFDVVLTNPPLGALNYQIIPFADTDDTRARLLRMPILPKKNLTEEQLRAKRSALINHKTNLAKLEEQPSSPKSSLAKRVERLKEIINRVEIQVSDLESRIRSGQAEFEITGNTMKGGAMFVAAIWNYLKSNAYPDNPPEWRGGKVLIVLDEGILNTDDYSDVRQFIRSHFYVKAVVSLTRDTFIPISKTSTKTSILYAVKNTDTNAVQREPIFFAHVDKVGIDTTGKVCANDLDAVLERYLDFKDKVLNSYVGLEFKKANFLTQGFTAEVL